LFHNTTSNIFSTYGYQKDIKYLAKKLWLVICWDGDFMHGSAFLEHKCLIIQSKHQNYIRTFDKKLHKPFNCYKGTTHPTSSDRHMSFTGLTKGNTNNIIITPRPQESQKIITILKSIYIWKLQVSQTSWVTCSYPQPYK